MKILTYSHLVVISIASIFLFSCNKVSQTPTGNLKLTVEHKVGNSPLEINKLIYSNAAGNQYLVSEVQWFISRLRLVRPDGTAAEVNMGEPIYFDTGIPAGLIKQFSNVPAGSYTALQFVFGLDEQMNTSLRYKNPPESFMFWPDYLGGGYHYLKLNGKWLNNNGLLEPYNFHLGIGQIYDTLAPKSTWVNMNDCCKTASHCEGYNPPQKTMPIKEFVHNHFEVSLPASIIVRENQTCSVSLEMHIDQWFAEPHIYDHNHWGGSIMQQQAAMKTGCENGRNVFRLVISDSR